MNKYRVSWNVRRMGGTVNYPKSGKVLHRHSRMVSSEAEARRMVKDLLENRNNADIKTVKVH